MVHSDSNKQVPEATKTTMITPLILTKKHYNDSKKRGLQTLLNLRWLSIIGQIFLVLISTYYWKVELPLPTIFLLLALQIISNFSVPLLTSSSLNLSGGVITFDLVMMTIMLNLTGGAANPFSVFYLVHVMLAAMMTNKGWTWLAVFISSLGFASLFWFDTATQGMSSHGQMHHGSESFSLHLQGMWLAYTLAAVIIAGFVLELSRLLEHEKEKRVQGEKLVALAALAAGAAHEIGNPLGTIRLITSDLEDYFKKNHPQQELLNDIFLINEELQRARKVIDKMSSSAGELSGESIQPLSTEIFFDELLKRFPTPKRIRLAITSSLPKQIIWPKEACTQIFIQLIRNALQASSKHHPISLELSSTSYDIHIRIIDRGKGMSHDILNRVGEPFFTTRASEGMGLGIFISKSLIERLNGSFMLSSEINVGTTIEVRLPICITA